MSDYTPEDVANALEDNAIAKALNLGPKDPLDGLKSNEIISDSQLNQRLMTPDWDSSKLTLMIPKTRLETCWVIKKGPDGKPLMFEGKPIVDEKSVKLFDGFETKEIDLPTKNIFKSDMRVSLLRPEDRNILQSLFDLYFFIVQESISTEEDFSYDLYNISQKIGCILNVAPSLGGKGAELLKTQITKAEQSNTIKQMLLNEQKKQGIFGKFFKQRQNND